MSVSYPSAQVRLQIRIDEVADNDDLKSKLDRGGGSTAGLTLPATKAGREAALQQNRIAQDQLGQQRTKLPSATYRQRKALLDAERTALQKQDQEAAGGNSAPRPDGLEANPEDARNIIFATLPLHVAIERNSIRDADTCSVTLDFKDVPVDPRIIRAALLTVTMGTVNADDYANGVLANEVRSSDGMFTSIVERRPDEELRITNTRTRFVGFIDEWRTEHTESGEVIMLQCRDLTAMLIDQRLPDGVSINMVRPIDEGVRELVNTFPQMRNMKVFFGTPTDFDARRFATTASQPGPIPADAQAEVQKSRKGQSKKKREDKETSVWDHIVTTAQKLGLVAFVRGFVIFISEPRNLYRQVQQKQKRMVYGINILTLNMARKLGAITTNTIEVRSYDPDIGRTRWARFPVLDNEPSSGILGDPNSPQPVTSRPNKISPSGTPTETVQTFVVPGVTDQARLETIAEGTWEEIGRQEIEGSFVTHDLDSFRQANDPTAELLPTDDLLDLQAGDPITLAIGRPPKETDIPTTVLQASQNESAAERAAFLESIGVTPRTAQRLALAQEQTRLLETFRAGYVNIEYSVDDGVQISVSFANFITIRETGEEDDNETSDAQSTPDNITEAIAGL